MNFTRILTLFMVLTLTVAAPVKETYALGGFFGGGGLGTPGFGSVFNGGLFGDGGLLGGVGSLIDGGINAFNGTVNNVLGSVGLGDGLGGIDLGGVIGGIANVPVLGDLFGGNPIAVTGASIGILEAGADILSGVITGGDLGNTASGILTDFFSGITTNNPALNDAILGALRGDDLGEALAGFGAGVLGNLTTGNAILDGLIRDIAGNLGGVVGDLLGIFGINVAGGCGGAGLGGVICNTVMSNQFVPFLFSGLSYLMGIILGIWGIWRLRMHVEQPNQVEIWDPLKRFLAGGAFFALPMLMEVVFNTVAFGIPGFDGSDFNGNGAVGGGLDAMLVALMRDIWTPMQMAFSGFCYLAGILLVMIGISRLLKSEQDGAKGPTGIGTVMTFLVAGALLSVDSMIGATSFSMFNGLEGQNEGALRYTAGMTGAEIAHANAVINAITAFVAVVGWISFIRGLFIIRGVAEGNSQASSMAGITHILGGAIAINLGPMLEAVQITLGIAGLNLGVEFQ